MYYILLPLLFSSLFSFSFFYLTDCAIAIKLKGLNFSELLKEKINT